MIDKISLSDSTSPSYITSSLRSSVNVLSSNSTSSSNVSLTCSISSSSCICWARNVLSLSSNILSLTTWNILSLTCRNKASLSNSYSSNWGITSLIDSFCSNTTLRWNVSWTLLIRGLISSSSFNISSLNISTWARDVIISFWIVNNLSFNWKILNSFPNSFNWFVLNDSLFDFFRNILDLSLNCIIVSDGSLDWNSFSSGDFFVFNNLSFIWNSFDSFDLIVLNIFLFEWNILNSWFNRDFFSNNFLN
jgi:hypothetical protein